MKDQSMYTTKIQHGEPIRFIGITKRSMGEGLFIREEII